MTALEFADDDELDPRPAKPRRPNLSFADQGEPPTADTSPGIGAFVRHEPVQPRQPAPPPTNDTAHAFAQPEPAQRPRAPLEFAAPDRPAVQPSNDTGDMLSTDPGIKDSVKAFTAGAMRQAQHPTLRFEQDSSEFTKGFLSGIDQTQGLLYGAAGLAGSALGIEGLRDWGVEGYQRNMAEAGENAPEVESITQVGNLGELGSWAAYTMGNLVPTMGALFAGGGLGAVAGKALVRRGIKDFTTREAKRRLARGATVGAAGGTFGGSFALEGGGIYNEVLEETGQDRPGVAAAFGSAAAMMDVLPVMYVFKKLGLGKQATEAITKKLLTDPSIKKDFKHVLSSGLKTAAGAASLESVTEGLQTVIEKAAIQYVDENKKIFTAENIDGIINVMAAGGLMGVTMGAGGVVRGVGDAAKARQKPILEFDDENSGAMPAGTEAPGETPGAETPGTAPATGRQVLEFADEGTVAATPTTDAAGSGESPTPGRPNPDALESESGATPAVDATRPGVAPTPARPRLEFADEEASATAMPARAEEAFVEPRRRRDVGAFTAPAGTAPVDAGQASAPRTDTDVVAVDPNEQPDPRDPRTHPVGVTGTPIAHEPGTALGTDAPRAPTTAEARAPGSPGRRPSRLEFADEGALAAAQPVTAAVAVPGVGPTQAEAGPSRASSTIPGFPESQAGNAESRRQPADAASDARLSRRGSDAGARPGLPLDAVEAWVGRTSARWSNAPEIVVAETVDGLPAPVKQAIRNQGNEDSNIHAAYWMDGVYIVAQNIQSQRHLEEVVFHEVYGHHGAKQLFGDAYASKMRELYNLLGGEAGLRRLAAKHNLDMDLYFDNMRHQPADRRIPFIMDEVLAHMQEKRVQRSVGRQATDIAKELLGRVRDWLRGHGFMSLAELTDSELALLLSRMERAVTGGSRDVVTPERGRSSTGGAVAASQASRDAAGVTRGAGVTKSAASGGAQAGAATGASAAAQGASPRSSDTDTPGRVSRVPENGAPARGRKALDRVAGAAKAAGSKLGIAGERPRGTPGREYTSEQRAAMERGGFGTRRKAPIAERIKGLRERIGTRLRQGVVDQYAALDDILKDGRAWMMAHLSSSGHGALEAIMDYGRIRLQDNAIAVDTSKPSLKQVLEPLGAELDDWLMWMAGQRAASLKKADKERLFSDVDIDALKSLGDGKMEGGKDRRAIYETVRAQFEAINDSVLDIAVETGLINNAERKAWKAQGVYIPFYRMLHAEETRGPRMFSDGLARQKGVEKLKGAELPLDDLLGNVLLNWSHLLGASLKNQAAVKALDSAEKMGLATSVSKEEKEKGAIYVRKEGREQWYDIEGDKLEGRLVLDALLSLNYEGLRGPVMKTMRAFKRALTVGVTANPSFRVANLLRDSIHSPAVVDMSTNIAKNVANGWKSTSKKSDLYASMIAGGGAFGDSGYVHGSDPELLRHLVTKRGIKRDTILDQRWRITQMWDAYQDLGARAENINRAAAFAKARADGKDLLEANFAARDLLDFSRTGAFPVIRFLTQTVPFLNARMQGLDKMGRALADPNQRKQFAAVVGVYVMASVALYLLMKDDDDFQEAEDWERDAYHLFKLPGSDIMYRLPKPFEVGVIGTVAERLTEQVVNDRVHGRLFAERLLHAMTDTLSFNPVPQLFRPGLELWGNRDAFTDRPIESASLRRLSPTERRRAWTSETAIGASHLLDTVLWDEVVLSPVQIEHLVQGYLGWLGATTLGAIDMLVTRPVTGAPDRPSMRLEDWPGIGRFVRENPTRHSRYVGEFYENLRAIETAYADIAGLRLLGEMGKARNVQRLERGKAVWRDLYRKAQQMEAKIQRAINAAYASKSMTPAAKRARIDSLTRRKNQIARSMVTRSSWAFE